MSLVASHPAHTRFACAMLTVLVGCTEAGQLTIALRVPTDDTATDTATTLTAAIARGAARLAYAEAPIDGGTFALGDLPVRDSLLARITALDQNRVLLAVGESAVTLPDGETCCVTVCLCGLDIFANGACTCGNEACSAQCVEP